MLNSKDKFSQSLFYSIFNVLEGDQSIQQESTKQTGPSRAVEGGAGRGIKKKVARWDLPNRNAALACNKANIYIKHNTAIYLDA